MKYRPHRGSLDQAMAEMVEVDSINGLVEHLNRGLSEWYIKITAEDIMFEPQGIDERIGWNSHLVCMRNIRTKHGVWYFGESMGPDYFGAIGHSDGPGS